MRKQFTVSTSVEEITTLKAYAAACDRSLSNFALHAMRSYMRRTKKKGVEHGTGKNVEIYPFAATRTEEKEHVR